MTTAPENYAAVIVKLVRKVQRNQKNGAIVPLTKIAKELLRVPGNSVFEGG